MSVAKGVIAPVKMPLAPGVSVVFSAACVQTSTLTMPGACTVIGIVPETEAAASVMAMANGAGVETWLAVTRVVEQGLRTAIWLLAGACTEQLVVGVTVAVALAPQITE